jgi:V/A-type H+-transporting ATPase subunit E
MQKAILTLVQDWAKDQEVVIEAKDSKALTEYFAANAKDLLNKGITIKEANNIKADFTIVPQKDGYKITFGDAELMAYFKEFLRPKLVEMLF